MILERLPVPASTDRRWTLGKMAWFAVAGAAAACELARARWQLRHVVGHDLGVRNRAAQISGKAPRLDPLTQSAVRAHLARAVPRMAGLVPWRSDCLVQAMAAQEMLRRFGISARIVIGAKKSLGEGFAPHAWLKSGTCIITGGEIDDYAVLYGDDAQAGSGAADSAPGRSGEPV
ncbi:lasso peptide biosynthesis B2 protein [Altererythrobacter lauratis]|uniref:Lasso peptide biosynthesis B2 protein n=1 Tax=Alteraurantiacibacter lauratis TaxID=2054627 RepID=A0ABV7EFA4_9SPHN